MTEIYALCTLIAEKSPPRGRAGLLDEPYVAPGKSGGIVPIL
jgi:hypothetical protein